MGTTIAPTCHSHPVDEMRRCAGVWGMVRGSEEAFNNCQPWLLTPRVKISILQLTPKMVEFQMVFIFSLSPSRSLGSKLQLCPQSAVGWLHGTVPQFPYMRQGRGVAGKERYFEKPLRFLRCSSEKIYVKWSAQWLANKTGERNISCCHEKGISK